jgi:sterol desaturase/sphingolipid hydroxylase (fatty acid hydroxylase superfamily)
MIARSTAVTVVLVMAALFALERFVPLRRVGRPLVGRLLVNLGISAFAFGAAMLLVRPAAQAAIGWSAQRPFGLIHLAEMPWAVQFIAAFLLMDLTFYWWHVANHRIPFLWRFHNVHHIDPDLDVSTAFRFHFGEVALSTVFRAIQVGAIGISAPTFAIYELVFQANTLFHHSNVRLPIAIERLLNLVLVTPRMHGIHHSQVREETNSNYSVVYSWWDRLHRSARLNVPQSAICVGVPAYVDPQDNSFRSALTLPFRRQRDYWCGADGATVRRDPGVVGDKGAGLAE